MMTVKKRLVMAMVVLVMVPALAIPGQAAPGDPGLELMVGAKSLTIDRSKGEPVYLDLGLFVASPDSALELVVRRPEPTAPLEVTQVVTAADGSTQSHSLPSDILDGWGGLKDFFDLRITDPDGRSVIDEPLPFCPNGYDRQRVTDEGPSQPTYPGECFDNPFTKAMVWGIDRGWAVKLGGENLVYRIPSGRYSASISVDERYQDLFSIDPEDATKTVSLDIRTVDHGCHDCRGGRYQAEAPVPEGAVPTLDQPAPAFLPDLVALPAWNIDIQQGRKRTRLAFSATVWASGNASLVVEGFRREGEDLMDAYQYFYDDDEPVGKAPVGSFEFDTRDGHRHWHFQQFARYSLLDADQAEVLRSRKEAFCLASTDAIDLLIPGAPLRPGNHDLQSACGTQDALWIRETLPLGWGDTYSQTPPGQSFDITDLPNGTYYVLVEANPGGSLYELSPDNNVELREIRIKGRPGNRRVIVPPWNGIDSEQGSKAAPSRGP